MVEIKSLTVLKHEVDGAPQLAGEDRIAFELAVFLLEPSGVGEGFWYCDTWLKDWTSHTNFPRLPEREHRDAIELIHELAYFLFTGDGPYEDDTLKTKAIG